MLLDLGHPFSECGQRAGSTERLVRCVAHLLTQVSALRLEDADIPAGIFELFTGLGAAMACGLPRGTQAVTFVGESFDFLGEFLRCLVHGGAVIVGVAGEQRHGFDHPGGEQASSASLRSR